MINLFRAVESLIELKRILREIKREERENALRAEQMEFELEVWLWKQGRERL